MSTSFEATLRIEPGFSPVLCVYLCVLYGSVLFSVAWAPIDAAWVVATAVVVIWHGVRACRGHLLHKGAAVALAVWHQDGSWSLVDATGAAQDAALSGSSYVHPRLIILNFRVGPVRRRTLVLLPDNTPAVVLRRLRARLRLSAP